MKKLILLSFILTCCAASLGKAPEPPKFMAPPIPESGPSSCTAPPEELPSNDPKYPPATMKVCDGNPEADYCCGYSAELDDEEGTLCYFVLCRATCEATWQLVEADCVPTKPQPKKYDATKDESI